MCELGESDPVRTVWKGLVLAVSRPYSTQFIGQAVTPSRTTATYAVPEGYRAVVRSIVISSSTAVPQLVIVYVEKQTAAFYLYLKEYSALGYDSHDLHQVVDFPHLIVAYTSVGSASVGVGGYLLQV